MDFLDPEKTRRQTIQLLVGYVFVAIAILFATTILLYEARGFGINQKGEVIQNGLVFVSSQPAPANIYVNGRLNKAQTDSRIILPEGTYSLRLNRTGYRPWQRTINVEGGQVDHVDYPFLFPINLTSTAVQNYDTGPVLTSQSPDNRWLLVQIPGSHTDFQLFDLKNPKLSPTVYAIPSKLFTAPTDPTASPQSWQVLEWAGDNRHMLVKHTYGTSYEYLLLDRVDATQSVNLTQLLGENPTELSLVNQHYDRYLLYESSDQTLKTASLGQPTPAAYVDNVLAYKSYGDNSLLYATPSSDKTKVKIVLKDSSKLYTIRTAPAGTTYLLDISQYSGDLIVVAGAVSENRVDVYKNPADQINDPNTKVAVPVQVLRVPGPSYLHFSDNSRFIVLESGNNFALYDNEDAKGFSYQTTESLDAPQVHASWMDGHRLQYVSGGKLVVFDFDYKNVQMLVTAAPGYLPFYNSTYKTLYTFGPLANAPGKIVLDTTPLLTPADQ